MDVRCIKVEQKQTCFLMCVLDIHKYNIKSICSMNVKLYCMIGNRPLISNLNTECARQCWEHQQGRSYGGGGGGHVPPINSRCVPPPTQKKHAYIFFNLPISCVCKYFAPHKNHAYAFLKYALNCFICKWLFLPIHMERNSTFIIKICFKFSICKWLFLPIHIERNSTFII